MFTSAMRNLSSGVMLGLIGTVLSLAFASLLFGGGSFSQFQAGVTAFLIAGVIATLVIGFLSADKALVALPLPSAVAVAGVLALDYDLAGQEVRLLLIGAGLLTALVMLAVGQARLGRMIHYLPQPVMAGLMAGIGWLLFTGGLRLVQPELLDLSLVLNPSLWLVLVFGALLFWARNRLGGPLVLPTGFLLLVFLFNLLGAGFPEWSGDWFFSGRSQSFWSMNWLPAYSRFTVADAYQLPWGGLLALAAVAVSSLLMQLSTLELERREFLNADSALQQAAAANLATGLIGGAVAGWSLSQTRTNQQMGGQGKAPAIIAALILLSVAVTGSLFWRYLPLPAVAVVLVYQGLVFMDLWLYRSRERFAWRDLQLALGLFAAVVVLGFLTAMVLALLMALGLYIRQFSKLQMIHHQTDATTLHSRIERSLRHKKALEKYGDRVQVVRLKGDLSLGNSYRLLEQLEPKLRAPCVFQILDLSRVGATDSSTAEALTHLHRLCTENKVILLLCGVSSELQQLLTAAGLDYQLSDPEQKKALTTRGLMQTAGIFTDWDQALQWCENELLSRLPTNESGEYTLESVLKERLDLLPYEVVHLVRYFESVNVPAGESFIRAGDKADSLYLVTKGRVNVELELGEERRQCLKTLLPGTVLGEMGVYTGGVRTAAATAVTDTQLMRLSAKSLQEMETHNQLMAVRLHRFVVLLLSQRLTDSNRMLEQLFD